MNIAAIATLNLRKKLYKYSISNEIKTTKKNGVENLLWKKNLFCYASITKTGENDR